MPHEIALTAGGRTRQPTPEFEANWAAERDWYARQPPLLHRRVSPSPKAARPSCRARGVRRQGALTRHPSERTDEAEFPVTLRSTAASQEASIGVERRMGLAARLGQLLASRWLRLRRKTR